MFSLYTFGNTSISGFFFNASSIFLRSSMFTRIPCKYKSPFLASMNNRPTLLTQNKCPFSSLQRYSQLMSDFPWAYAFCNASIFSRCKKRRRSSSKATCCVCSCNKSSKLSTFCWAATILPSISIIHSCDRFIRKRNNIVSEITIWRCI